MAMRPNFGSILESCSEVLDVPETNHSIFFIIIRVTKKYELTSKRFINSRFFQDRGSIFCPWHINEKLKLAF